MRTWSHTVEIRRSPEEVFAFVSDPEAYPRRQPSLVRVEPHRPGPIRLGSEATEVRRFLGRSAVECALGPVPFRGTFQLEPSAVGTIFTWTVETCGTATRLAGPLLEREPAACPNE
jgi:hypothetical protein